MSQWLLTCTGRQHYLAGPSATHPDNVPSLGEIAHSLAHINRYTGHATRAYSVAEHSLLVMEIARTEFDADAGGQLAALMHDAHECIVGDVASPIKQVLGSAWAAFEAVHEHHLRHHYQLLALYEQHGAMVKRCDLIALATERRDLTAYAPSLHRPWPLIDTPGRVVQPWRADLLHPPSKNGADCAFLCAREFETAATDLLDQTKNLRTALQRDTETT